MAMVVQRREFLMVPPVSNESVKQKELENDSVLKRFFLCQERSVSQHDVAKRRSRAPPSSQQRPAGTGRYNVSLRSSTQGILQS